MSLLGQFAKPIPYYKSLRDIAGSVTAAILLTQLEYWFSKYPYGFYKFLEPCENKAYIEGDSWAEELGFTASEFRTAFAHIGVAHQSKTAFREAQRQGAVFIQTDKQGRSTEKLFCSVRDRISGQTFYYRNDRLVDTAIAGLQPKRTTPSSVTQQPSVTEVNDLNLRNSTTFSYVTQRSSVPLNTETTTETTAEITHTSAAKKRAEVCVVESQKKIIQPDATKQPVLVQSQEANSIGWGAKDKKVPPPPAAEIEKYRPAQVKVATGDCADWYNIYNREKPDSWAFVTQTVRSDRFIRHFEREYFASREEAIASLRLALLVMKAYPDWYSRTDGPKDKQFNSRNFPFLIKARDGKEPLLIEQCDRAITRGILPKHLDQMVGVPEQIVQEAISEHRQETDPFLQRMEQREKEVAAQRASLESEIERASRLDRQRKGQWVS